MDGGPAIDAEACYDLYATPPGPLEREHITEPLVTGVRAIDSLLPFGKGQRIGIFGGSGVGKSTLLGAMARHNSADVSVIALIGERNREVREFHRKGTERGGTGAQRGGGGDVRHARAAAHSRGVRGARGGGIFSRSGQERAAGAGFGDAPGHGAARNRARRGRASQPERLHAQRVPTAAQIFERAGNFRQGSITGFFTVLVEGDDFNEPICDAVRAILDGHIVLSRELGAMGHYPAIDILNSVSRLAGRVATPEHREAARKIREALAAYQQSEDLINLGAYAAGSNGRLDSAIRLRPKLLDFLRQDAEETEVIDETLKKMYALAQETG